MIQLAQNFHEFCQQNYEMLPCHKVYHEHEKFSTEDFLCFPFKLYYFFIICFIFIYYLFACYFFIQRNIYDIEFYTNL